MSAQAAFDHLGAMLENRYRRFKKAVAEVPSWGEPADANVHQYIEGVKNVVRANLYWSFQTERFFGKRRDEVRRSFKVDVLLRPPYLREAAGTGFSYLAGVDSEKVVGESEVRGRYERRRKVWPDAHL